MFKIDSINISKYWMSAQAIELLNICNKASIFDKVMRKPEH